MNHAARINDNEESVFLGDLRALARAYYVAYRDSQPPAGEAWEKTALKALEKIRRGALDVDFAERAVIQKEQLEAFDDKYRNVLTTLKSVVSNNEQADLEKVLSDSDKRLLQNIIDSVEEYTGVYNYQALLTHIGTTLDINAFMASDEYKAFRTSTMADEALLSISIPSSPTPLTPLTRSEVESLQGAGSYLNATAEINPSLNAFMRTHPKDLKLLADVVEEYNKKLEALGDNPQLIGSVGELFTQKRAQQLG